VAVHFDLKNKFIYASVNNNSDNVTPVASKPLETKLNAHKN